MDHIELRRAPMTASETMPAAGMLAANGPKCVCANTYARVGDLLKVSMTRVRLEASDICFDRGSSGK
jgi:hypothetical protein